MEVGKCSLMTALKFLLKNGHRENLQWINREDQQLFQRSCSWPTKIEICYGIQAKMYRTKDVHISF